MSLGPLADVEGGGEAEDGEADDGGGGVGDEHEVAQHGAQPDHARRAEDREQQEQRAEQQGWGEGEGEGKGEGEGW